MRSKFVFYGTITLLSLLLSANLLFAVARMISRQSVSPPQLSGLFWAVILMGLIYFVLNGSNMARITLLIVWMVGAAFFVFGYGMARIDHMTNAITDAPSGIGFFLRLADFALVIVVALFPIYSLGFSKGFRAEMQLRRDKTAKKAHDSRSEFYKSMGEDPDNPWRPGYGPSNTTITKDR